MNIFVLDHNVFRCAEYHNDSHVCKMILESAQMLCTTVRLCNDDYPEEIYKATHVDHGCSKWLRESLSNWRWLRELAFALGYEFNWRYERAKDHKSIGVIEMLPKPNIPDLGLTPFYQAMPKRYREEDPVAAYRKYYNMSKRHLSAWRRRGMPYWWWDEDKHNLFETVESIERQRK